LDLVYAYALSLWGIPYVWGGENTEKRPGLDCSGLVQLILAKAGLDPWGDQTADRLYRWFSDPKRGTREVWGLGALAFFGIETRIHHIGWCLDKRIMINAAGGGPTVTSISAAKKVNASVKIEPIASHSHLHAIIMPNYG
jgi:cell wall-associated NlpC family hydrolase